MPDRSHQLKVFTGSLKIKLLNSSAYYVQANGQTRSSNKTLIRLIKKIIEDCPRRWHDVLLEALWARTSKHSATKVTPVELVYGQGAVLSAEINLQVHRVIKPDTLSVEDYTKLMMEKIDEMPEGWFRVLNEIERDKVRVVKAYNKKVVEWSFQVGELVWIMILPLGINHNKYGKWSPGWEGAFRVVGIVPGNAYFVEAIEGHRVKIAMNNIYLKKYDPSIWQGE
jgi:hypothetical protein